MSGSPGRRVQLWAAGRLSKHKKKTSTTPPHQRDTTTELEAAASKQQSSNLSANRLLSHPLLVNHNPVVTRKADSLDLAKRLPPAVFTRILLLLDFKTRTRLQRVSRMWQMGVFDAEGNETRPVWLYIIFRKNHASGHERLTVNVSVDGPIFWGKLVAYVYCCSCHFSVHEKSLITLFKRISGRVERVCMVDNPLQYPFIPDSFFEYMADHFTVIQFIYLRDIDLENVSLTTTKKFAAHQVLKKVITHGCRKIDVFKDFRQLPQLLDFKGEIQGLKAFLGDIDVDSGSTSSSQSRSLSKQSSTAGGASDIAVQMATVTTIGDGSDTGPPTTLGTTHNADGPTSGVVLAKGNGDAPRLQPDLARSTGGQCD